MTRRLLRLTLVGALLCGLDAPAVLLQGYAWTTMVLHGLRGGSVGRAVTETFDGRHPCEICRRVHDSAPTASLSATPQPKLDFFPPLAAPAAEAGPVRSEVAAPRLAAQSRGAAPPVPPPDARAC